MQQFAGETYHQKNLTQQQKNFLKWKSNDKYNKNSEGKEWSILTGYLFERPINLLYVYAFITMENYIAILIIEGDSFWCSLSMKIPFKKLFIFFVRETANVLPLSIIFTIFIYTLQLFFLRHIDFIIQFSQF